MKTQPINVKLSKPASLLSEKALLFLGNRNLEQSTKQRARQAVTQSHCNDTDIAELLRNFRETSGHPSENSRVLLLLPSSAEP